jgi:hypothetical protein
VFDARQLLDEAAAGGDDQGVVGEFALVGDHGAPAILEPGHPAGDEFDGMVLEEQIERKDQVLALAQAGGNPDQAGQVDELGLGRDQADAGIGARRRSSRTAVRAPNPAPRMTMW